MYLLIFLTMGKICTRTKSF